MTEPRPSQTSPDGAPPRGAPADQTVARTDAQSPTLWRGAEDYFAPPANAGEVGTFGRYRVLKLLGRGGMGAVYLGYDPALERKVALKVMLPQFAEDADAKERFLREARSAAKVRSDHVVAVFDVGEQGGGPFIAMEYLLGLPLDQYLKTKGELPLAQVLRVGRETALGLAAAHALGLVHRDIKPGNIWLEAPKGRVKILDFGLARPATDEHLTNSGAVVGTPAYMSPEQGRGLKLDHRSDLFSLGTMLYRLSTGKMPFTGNGTMAVLTSLAVDTPTPPRQINPQLPEALEAVITKLLAKDPAARFQSAKDVAAALRDIEHPQAPSGPLPVVVALPVPPLTIGAQTQNVWEGIDASESVPVPVATPTDATSADSSPAPAEQPKPPRVKRERKASKWPMILAGVGLLTAVAVLVVVLSRTGKKDEPVVQNKEPGGTQPAANPDRKAAEYVLSLGGLVKVNGEEKEIRIFADLPKEPFTLTGVWLSDTQVNDAGLANLKDCKHLLHLNLYNTKVGNTGLAYFVDCKNLLTLGLGGTAVTDDGIARLRDRQNLKVLDVSKTNVTSVAAEKLAQSLPQCRIVHNGGTIEPKAVADPDRRAAEWVLGLGGVVRVKGVDRDIKTPAELPKDGFSLTHVNLSGNDKVTDEGVANLGGCTSLTNLSLGSTSVSGAGLIRLKNCTSLSLLELNDTQLDDTALTALKDFERLIYINLNNTQVGDAGLVHLEGLAKLRGLNVKGSQVTEPGAKKLAAKLPGCKIVHNGGIIEPKAVADPDRAAAEWVLSLGGNVDVNVMNDTRKITKPADLPPEFRLARIDLKSTVVADADLGRLQKLPELASLNLSETAITDEGLARVGELKSLRGVLLTSCPKVADAGMKHLRKLPLLNTLDVVETGIGNAGLRDLAGQPLLYYLYLSNTKVTDDGLPHLTKLPELLALHLNSLPVTDAGLAHLIGCKKLRALELTHTGITDEGLKHLEKITTLRTLNLKQTKVTKGGVEKLFAALPQCKIEWDGPTIEPEK